MDDGAIEMIAAVVTTAQARFIAVVRCRTGGDATVIGHVWRDAIAAYKAAMKS